MMDDNLQFFLSFFANPTIYGITIALLFAAIWLAPFYNSIIKRTYAWVIFLCSAILTTFAIAFIQDPLQILTGDVCYKYFQKYNPTIIIFLIPVFTNLIAGVVQETAKLLPVLLYWRSMQRALSPAEMLFLGVMGGVGFGFFEAQWVANRVISSGWNLDLIRSEGISAAAGFIERFFSVGCHTAWTAIAAYGLTRRKWYLYFLIVVFAHALADYDASLYSLGVFDLLDAEIAIAINCCLSVAFAIELRIRAKRD